MQYSSKNRLRFLIISKVPLLIFVSWYLPKRELTLCWSMSIKSSALRCLSIAVANVPCNCWEVWKQLISSNFQNGTFEIIIITVTKIVLIQVFFLPLLLNKKMKTQSTIAPSYYLKVSSTQNQRVPFFYCLAHEAIISLYLGNRAWQI